MVQCCGRHVADNSFFETSEEGFILGYPFDAEERLGICDVATSSSFVSIDIEVALEISSNLDIFIVGGLQLDKWWQQLRMIDCDPIADAS